MSSPTHIARCLQSALTLLAATPGYRCLAGRVSAVAADTTVTGRGLVTSYSWSRRTRPQSGAVDFADVARAALPLLGRPSAVGYLDEWSSSRRLVGRTRA